MKPKILIVDGAADPDAGIARRLHQCETVEVASLWRALSLLSRNRFAGVFVEQEHLQDAIQAGTLLQNSRILDGLPDGVALVDSEGIVLWANATLRQWGNRDRLFGLRIEQIFPDADHPERLPAALNLALSRRDGVTVPLRAVPSIPGGPPRHLRLQMTPVYDTEHGGRSDSVPEHAVLIARDATAENEHQQKLVAIHKAGTELADLRTEEVAQMSVEERTALLRENILHHTKDLLQFDVIEVRVLDLETRRLKPMVSYGMQPMAEQRELFANELGNGVTGYVAATGRSYVCRDTTTDPRYLEGCKGGRSSMTVPLAWGDEVIGTFNVESPRAGAFSDSDLQFLEIFAREVALALHTLDLLAVEQAVTIAKNVERIHGAVALPIDTILNDAVMVMDAYGGGDPEIRARLLRIQTHARDIKAVIQAVGREMSPGKVVPVAGDAQAPYSSLRDWRVLVVDAEANVRQEAHRLLEPVGCEVETAHDGAEAVRMARAGDYQAIMSDISLPDMNGFELLTRLQQQIDEVPIVFMKGFGYDPSHTEVKARRAGVKAFVAKPFIRDQVLQTLERLEPLRGTGDQPRGSA